MTYKQKPLTQAQQRAHRAALKGFRGDNASYVTRKVTRAPCARDFAHFLPLSADAFAGAGLVGSLNVFSQRWNGEVMK